MSIEGHISFDLPSAGKPLQTWYRVYGDLHQAGGRRPLIILSGGPGIPSDYMSPLASALWEKCSIPTVMYDQIGCGRSTHLTEKRGDVEFWAGNGVTYLFQQQLESVIAHLGIGSNYDLVGFSFGGVTAFDYHVNHDDGLKHLVLAGTPCDFGRWEAAIKGLLRELPGNVLEKVEKHEAAGTLQDPEYGECCALFLSEHMCRIPQDQQPPELKHALDLFEQDPTIYATLNGPYEFTITGPLKTWSATSKMGQVKVPTLITNGAFDCVPSEMHKSFVDGIHDTEWVVFEKSAHMAHLEEPNKYVEVVDKFLRK